MSELQALFGRHLRDARKARGLTQAELAERIDRSLDMVGRLERGEIAPSFETIERALTVLDLDAAELFGGQSSFQSPRSDSLRQALEALEAMPLGKLKQALGVIKAL